MMAGSAAFWYVGCVYIFDWIRLDKHKHKHKHKRKHKHKKKQRGRTTLENHSLRIEEATARDSKTMVDILWIAVLQNAVQLPTSIYFGYLVDRYGLRSVFPAVLGACLVAGYPIYALLDDSLSLPVIVLGPGILFGIVSGALGTTSNLLSSDIFHPKARHRGVGLGYNTSIMIFGGLGPAWVELAKDSIPLAAGYFLMLTAAFSFIVYYFYGYSLLPLSKPMREE
eukprot:jgi/Bigna1/91065/estExt_fgenesh1_pg.C_870052